MTKHEIVGFIRDNMLTDPSVDAELPWSIARKALNEEAAYVLMSRWMETNSQFTKNVIMRAMERYLRDTNYV